MDQNAGHAVPHVNSGTGDVSVASTPEGGAITRSGEGYWNTTKLEGDALAAAVRQAKHQDVAILAIFRGARGPLTPWEVLHRCEAAGKRWPITSIRRSITNLTDAGALVRLDSKRIGDFGRPEFEWGLAA